ncbi:hypothetical protein [Kitasatospora aureofaciens]|uniref:hypothetical protein n=1 Tax=Kitasatospora aureofaciens TaxID=1894 RepID=UPI001C44AAED|nr:hypothetical protein [Kitasatospora aureofaciens]MBV6696880.1 hypothetical protein [Kitasatospora aureofaciens]
MTPRTSAPPSAESVRPLELFFDEPDGAGVTAAVNACDPVERARLDASAWDLLCALDRLRPDLEPSVYMGRFDAGMSLALGAGFGSPGYDVEALLQRAGGDPAHAAELVASDQPSNPRQSS